MATVTQRIREFKQPRGGYINPRRLEKTKLESSVELFPEENINPSLIGLSVDYLSRYISGATKEEAFEISLKGAFNVRESEKALKLLSEIDGLSDQSIINATKLVGYDVAYRAGIGFFTKPVDTINPDKDTISNIREMVNRSKVFFEKFGPVILDGFSFEGAYTDLITIGDADFLTKDTLWDFKVTKNPPTNKHTFQILIYYLMGLRSIHKEKFSNVKRIGFFNPRLNIVHTINISDISKETIEEVNSKVIGY